jgi:hypothetical protein
MDRHLSGQIFILMMTFQRSGQFPRFEVRIGKEQSLIKIESEKVYENIVCFGLRFYRIVEEFRFFGTLILECLNLILSNECFVPSFNLIAISDIDIDFVVMNDKMKKLLDTVDLGRMRNVIEYNEFYHDCHEKTRSQFSVLQMPIFCDSVFLIEIDQIVDLKVRTFDTAFVLNQNKIEKCLFSWKCSYDKIESQFSVFYEVLKLSGGSGYESVSTFYRKKSNHCIEIHDFVKIINVNTFCDSDSLTEIIFASTNNLREIHGFEKCVSLRRIEIPSSVEVIGEYGFSECTSLNEVLFSSGGHLRVIDGFRECTSLYRIEIPSSVEVISWLGFIGCTSLNEVIFSSDRQLREINGFGQCTSLCRIEIPSSVEQIWGCGFSGCTSLNEVIFSSDSHLRELHGFEKCTSLCRIEIPSSVQSIGKYGFRECTSLNEIIFSSDSHLREINGLGQCTSLCRIEIPSSVQKIREDCFNGCTSLNEVLFSSESHCREIHGFEKCSSLYRIEIPSSVEVIGEHGFFFCTSLRIVVIRTGCRMKENEGLQNIYPFLVYEDGDVKKYRRYLHLGIGRRIL